MQSRTLSRFIALALTLALATAAHAQAPLYGWVDMHAHPRGDLAYGRDLYHGAPCGDIAAALGSCKAHHGAKGFGNPDGNLFRKTVAAQTEQQFDPGCTDGHAGYPDFETWPRWSSILHQQMWIDWVERAHANGLRVMVALAVSSHCIASAAKTTGPQDDGTVMNDLILGIKDFVAAGDFMEIAYSPADLRRIVGAGKLAVVIGSEMDNIGNFYSPQDHYPGNFNAQPTEAQLKAEIDRLWDMGVRYIFPVHLNNTVFGGTAIAMSQLNVANKFATGQEFQLEAVNTAETGIATRLDHPSVGLNAIAKLFMPALLPKNVNPGRKENYTNWQVPEGHGQRNTLGITPLGRVGIDYLMEKGFLIDIDHMSERMADTVIAMALRRGYPLCSGHSGPRAEGKTEGDRTPAQYAALRQIGSMVGMGHGMNAAGFVASYRETCKQFGSEAVAIGTDVGGFSPLPAPDKTVQIAYDDQFQRCTTGNRTWDFNVDGVAHYGLWPDYMRAWQAAGMTAAELDAFMHTAEAFARTWERTQGR